MVDEKPKNEQPLHSYVNPALKYKKFDFKLPKERNKLLAILFIIFAIPVTVGLALTQQNYLNFASNTEIDRVAIHPGIVSADAYYNGRPIAMSVLAYDTNGNPINSEVTYQWVISSQDEVGSLTKTTGDISEFIPGNNLGCGQLTVTATYGDKTVTKSALLEVYRGSEYPACAGHTKALYLDGSSWVNFPDGDKKLDFNQNFTIEMWVNPEVLPNGKIYMPILAREFDNQTITARFYFLDLDHLNSETGYEYQGEVGGVYDITNMIKPVTWTHLALVRENTEPGKYDVKGYVNGELKFTKSTEAGEVNIPSSETVLGRLMRSNDGERFIGRVDQIRVSQTVRNVPENWSNGVYQRPMTTDADTVSLWEFEDNLQDSSGNGANGVAGGSVYYLNSFIVSPPLPSSEPTTQPTATDEPTPTPTVEPTSTPTPTPLPTNTPTPSPTKVPSPSNMTMTLKPMADTFVKSIQVNKNFGTWTTMEVDNDPVSIGLVKFNLKSLAGKTIVSASLNLKVSDASINSLTLQRANDKVWSETAVTYSTRPGVAATIRSFTAPTVGQTLTLPVTNPVNLKKGSTVTFMISSTGTDRATFYSKEAKGANVPTLTVVYR